MSRKCSAAMCAVDDSGGLFRLFPMPTNVETQGEWLLRMRLCTTDIKEKVLRKDEIYLCEVHFDETCWDGSGGEKTLKETSVPSIFQHTTPLTYVDKVYGKLKSVGMCPELCEEGMQAIHKVKCEGVLRDANMHNELVRFSNLLVTSGMQKLRISLKSAAIATTTVENIMLAKEINNMVQKFPCHEEEK